MASLRITKGVSLREAASDELLSEWDYDKNNGVTPDSITPGSRRKVWWVCSNGHSYDTVIRNRLVLGTGCPCCSGKRVVVGETDLVTTNPDIAAEWDYEKNGDIKPSHVKAGSNKKFWWICHNGHQYEAAVAMRTREDGKSSGCPYCANKKILVGFNDLATTYPDVAAEWDYEKNGNLTPLDVTFGSGRKIWWRCSVGHSYCSVVRSRAIMGTGCPYCSGRLPIVGENDLATTNPDIAVEWDYGKNGDLTPLDISAGSRKKVWWLCSNGHQYKASVLTRTRADGRSAGCPYCANKRPVIGENDLATTHPDIVAEWDYVKNGDLLPTGVKAGSQKKAWWRCSVGHSYCAVIASHVVRGTGCPYCANQKVLVGFNDLKTTHPGVAAEWDYDKNVDLTPLDVTSGYDNKVWWRCSVGHSYYSGVYSRAVMGTCCPYCTGRYAIAGETDLATTHPDIVDKWDYEKNGDLTPLDVKAGSHKKVWWRCSLGHSYNSLIYAQVARKCGCPYCAGMKVLKGFNDLKTKRPDVADEWDYDKNGDLKPTDVTFGSGRKVWWLCSVGHSYCASIDNRTVGGKGCPYCSNKKILVGFNDLATTYPDIAQEWDYEKNGNLKPTDITFGSNKKVWWRCLCGHEYKSIISNRTRLGCGCVLCSCSHGEKFVEQYFKRKYVTLVAQWQHIECRYKGLLSFDFAIFDDKSSELPVACIEYQGEQHYRPVDFFGGKRSLRTQQKRDGVKREFCEKNGIPLILIPFSFNTQELVDEMLDACFEELGIG